MTVIKNFMTPIKVIYFSENDYQRIMKAY